MDIRPGHTNPLRGVLHRTRLIEEESRPCDEAADEENQACLEQSVGENEDPTVPAPPLALLQRLRSSSGFAAQSSSALESMRIAQRRAKSLAALPRSAVAPPPSESEPASIHDYTCPICLELLLRPVQLSCGHRFCRGCWVRVLQSREARATAELSPSPSPSHPDPLTLT